ncbi:MAG: hypothetical protein CM15mV42_1760 [uncultured marine virus]|nr:MAG: hypothetical protein CM15mV42_1760 [uncultured marine virus]
MITELYIIEARDVDTNHLEKRRLYTSRKQFRSIGKNQIDILSKSYNVKVTKYKCSQPDVIVSKQKLEYDNNSRN